MFDFKTHSKMIPFPLSVSKVFTQSLRKNENTLWKMKAFIVIEIIVMKPIYKFPERN